MDFFGKLEVLEDGLYSLNIPYSLDILTIRARHGTHSFYVQFSGSDPRLISPPFFDGARGASDENSFSFLCAVFIALAVAMLRRPEELVTIVNAIEQIRVDNLPHVSMGDLVRVVTSMQHEGEKELFVRIIQGLSIFAPNERPSCDELKRCVLKNYLPAHPVAENFLHLGGFRIFHNQYEPSITIDLRETFDMMLVRWLYRKRFVFISVEELGWVQLHPCASDIANAATDDQSFSFLCAMCLVLILIYRRHPRSITGYASFFRDTCQGNPPQLSLEEVLPSIPDLLDPTGITAVKSALSSNPRDRPRSNELLELIKPNFKTVLFA